MTPEEWSELCHALVRDPELADDIAQDAALEDAAALGSQSPRHAGAYARGRIRHRAGRLRQRDRARREREQIAARPEAVDFDPGRAELLRILDEELQALGPGLREMVRARYLEGRPPRALAEEAGIPVETVRTQLRRALADLRGRLDRRVGDREQWVRALAGSPAGLGAGGASRAVGGRVASPFGGPSARLWALAAVAIVGVVVWGVGSFPPRPEPSGRDFAASPTASESASSAAFRDEDLGRSASGSENGPIATGREIGELIGTVVDAEGAPVEGVEVEARLADTYAVLVDEDSAARRAWASGRARTDEAGRFTIPGLWVSRRYAVRALEGDPLVEGARVAFADTLASPARYQRPVDLGVLELGLARVLRGRVVDGDGRGVTGVRVSAWPERSLFADEPMWRTGPGARDLRRAAGCYGAGRALSGRTSRVSVLNDFRRGPSAAIHLPLRAVTDGSGGFVLGPMPEVAMGLLLEMDGRPGRAFEMPESFSGAWTARLPKGRDLELTVVDAGGSPVAGAEVWLSVERPDLDGSEGEEPAEESGRFEVGPSDVGQTSASGVLLVQGIAADVARVTVRHPSYPLGGLRIEFGEEESVLARRVTLGEGAAVELAVTETLEGGEWSFELFFSAGEAGYQLDPNGVPRVELTGRSKSIGPRRLLVERLDHDRGYLVVASDRSGRTARAEFRTSKPGARSVSGAAGLAGSNDEVQQVTLQAVEQSGLVVEVLDSEGQPIQDARVLGVGGLFSERMEILDAWTDRDGRVVFPWLKSSEVPLTVSHPDLGTVISLSDAWTRRCQHRGLAVLGGRILAEESSSPVSGGVARFRFEKPRGSSDGEAWYASGERFAVIDDQGEYQIEVPVFSVEGESIGPVSLSREVVSASGEIAEKRFPLQLGVPKPPVWFADETTISRRSEVLRNRQFRWDSRRFAGSMFLYGRMGGVRSSEPLPRLLAGQSVERDFWTSGLEPAFATSLEVFVATPTGPVQGVTAYAHLPALTGSRNATRRVAAGGDAAGRAAFPSLGGRRAALEVSWSLGEVRGDFVREVELSAGMAPVRLDLPDGSLDLRVEPFATFLFEPLDGQGYHVYGRVGEAAQVSVPWLGTGRWRLYAGRRGSRIWPREIRAGASGVGESLSLVLEQIRPFQLELIEPAPEVGLSRAEAQKRGRDTAIEIWRRGELVDLVRSGLGVTFDVRSLVDGSYELVLCRRGAEGSPLMSGASAPEDWERIPATEPLIIQPLTKGKVPVRFRAR